jgi:hypothetical protein
MKISLLYNFTVKLFEAKLPIKSLLTVKINNNLIPKRGF